MRLHSSRARESDAMIDLSKKEVWFVTGNQHLYGDASADRR